MSKSAAYYDTLAICNRLEPVLHSVAASEIHLFAYLSCLLALYRKNPVSDWGYEFGAVAGGYPFSATLEDTIQSLVGAGYLQYDTNNYLCSTIAGKSELEWIESLHGWNSREEFIIGACDSAVSLPLGIIRNALNQSSDLQATKILPYTRLLPSDAGITVLHDHFDALSQALGVTIDDLAIPAVVWLQFLSSASSENTLSNEA